MTKVIDFHIDHIDPLGQGVSKIGDKVTFIPKTLPGEEGTTKIYREKSRVQFGVLKSLNKPSSYRTSAACPHYESCPGCHFLHTSYEQELEFKKKSMQRLFRNWEIPIEVSSSPERLSYRNRIQLHYNLNSKKIGFIDSKTNKIIEVPNCKIVLPQIKEKLDQLYENMNWLREALPLGKKKGHLELYQRNDEVRVSWNQNYASGGFSQVHGQMNKSLIQLVNKTFPDPTPVWDLFGGSGNLTAKLEQEQVWVVDNIPKEKINLKDHQQFSQINLYSKNSLSLLKEKAPFLPQSIILDPPRSGMKHLKDLLKLWPVQKVLYISCNPDSLLRDVQSLNNSYKIKKLYLLDLFPGTFHYEAAALLQKNT